ncbi:MAG: TRAP transporter large permease subunit [Pseudomonadota bacterium]
MTVSPLLCATMLLAVCGLLMAGFPVAFTLAGVATLFALGGAAAGAFDLALLAAFPQRIFAVMSSEVLVAVPLFVFMGVVLERSRVAEDLLDAMSRSIGSLPGGLALAVTLVGMLLAASTGIVGATVVTMGLLALPTMLARGYRPSFAAGSICAAGTLGQIIPPSIVLVILGDQISIAYQNAQYSRGVFAPDPVSVNDLFAGALLPGLLLVGLYLAYQFAYSVLQPHSAPRTAEADSARPDIRGLLGTLLAPLLLIIAVLGSILAGIASPTEAASVGAVGAILLAGMRAAPERTRAIAGGAFCMAGLLLLANLFDLRLQRDHIPLPDMGAIGTALLLAGGLMAAIARALSGIYAAKTEAGIPVLVSALRSTVQVTSMIFVILIGATLFSLVFRGFGGDTIIEEALGALPGGAAGAILMVMLVMFVMGFFLDFLEIVFIVVPIVAPILLQMEFAPGELISPIWLGVMIAINIQTSFLTPPFGFALFYLRGVAPDAIRTTEIYQGVLPFVSLQLLALVILWFLPDLATWLPEQLYGK